MALALGGHPDQDVDLPGGIHAHGRALEGPQPRALGIARDAHAEAARAVSLRGLAPAPLVIAEQIGLLSLCAVPRNDILKS